MIYFDITARHFLQQTLPTAYDAGTDAKLLSLCCVEGRDYNYKLREIQEGNHMELCTGITHFCYAGLPHFLL